MKTVDKLYKQIMEYWEACAYCNCEKDLQSMTCWKICFKLWN